MGRKLIKIICPKCGRQYLPGEIYVPNAFIGQPKNIQKDYRGHILDFQGSSMDTRETYVCDSCDTKFSVRATVQFFTEIKENVNVSQPFRLNLQVDDNKLTLDEL